MSTHHALSPSQFVFPGLETDRPRPTGSMSISEYTPSPRPGPVTVAGWEPVLSAHDPDKFWEYPRAR